MSIYFSLDSRPNRKGEYPIRFTWSYKGVRVQSTVGRSVQEENWSGPFVQRVVCSLKDDRYPVMEETNRLLEEIEIKTKDLERMSRYTRLSSAKMKAFIHELLKGDDESFQDRLLQEGQLQTEDEETVFRKRGDDRHLYKKIAEARDQTTNMKMVVYRRLSGRTVFVASVNYFASEFTPIK